MADDPKSEASQFLDSVPDGTQAVFVAVQLPDGTLQRCNTGIRGRDLLWLLEIARMDLLLELGDD